MDLVSVLSINIKSSVRFEESVSSKMDQVKVPLKDYLALSE